MLKGDGVNIPLKLEIVETITDNPPPKHHVQDLLDRAAALVFELIVDREG